MSQEHHQKFYTMLKSEQQLNPDDPAKSVIVYDNISYNAYLDLAAHVQPISASASPVLVWYRLDHPDKMTGFFKIEIYGNITVANINTLFQKYITSGVVVTSGQIGTADWD